jgi:hypothetical protein
MVGVGLPARQRRFEPFSGGGFPLAKVAPEQAVEAPEQTVAIGTELVEIDVTGAVVVGLPDRPDRGRERIGNAGAIGLPHVDGDLGERHRLALQIRCPANDHRIAEVGLVLNPVEMDAQRTGDEARNLTLRGPLTLRFLALRNVIDVDDHRFGSLLVVEASAPGSSAAGADAPCF